MNRNRRHVRALTAIAAATLLGLTACGSGGGSGSSGATGEDSQFGGETMANGDAAQGGSYTFAMFSPVEHLDPTQPIGASLINPMRAVYDALMTLDASGNAVPHLAESMEPSEDYKTWVMTLPDGVTFSDGTPFNAQAVVDHVNNVADSTSLQALQAQQIKSATAKSETEVEFQLEESWAAFANLFADSSSLAMVPSPTAFKEGGDQFGLNPVGAGAYVVEEFVSGQSITMKRNPDYYRDDLPYADTVEYQTLAEPDARISGLQSGDVDIAALRTPAEVTSAQGAGLTVLEQPSYNYYTIYMNLKDPALKDSRVRQAISMAIDREGMNEVVFNGENEPMTGFFTTDHPYYTDTAEWPAFDKEAAQELVDEYKSETGNEISLDLTLPGSPEMNRIAAVLQQQLGAIGIDFQYKSVAPTTMVADAASGNWQLQMRDSGIQPESLLRLNTNFNSNSPASVVGEANPELDELLAQANQAPEDERAELLEQIQEELSAWMPQVPLVSATSAIGVGSAVTHFPGSYPTTTVESFDPALVGVK